MALYCNGQGRYQAAYQRLAKQVGKRNSRTASIAGELIRAIRSLASDAYRNGSLNWDSEYRDLVRLLRQHLLHKDAFGDPTKRQIRKDLSAIEAYGEGKCEIEFSQEDPWDRITDRIVEWSKLYAKCTPPEIKTTAAKNHKRPLTKAEKLRRMMEKKLGNFLSD
jgi:hypothetical protein